jgi:hypothetical protein
MPRNFQFKWPFKFLVHSNWQNILHKCQFQTYKVQKRTAFKKESDYHHTNLGEVFNIYNNIFVPFISFYRRQLHISARLKCQKILTLTVHSRRVWGPFYSSKTSNLLPPAGAFMNMVLLYFWSWVLTETYPLKVWRRQFIVLLHVSASSEGLKILWVARGMRSLMNVNRAANIWPRIWGGICTDWIHSYNLSRTTENNLIFYKKLKGETHISVHH